MKVLMINKFIYPKGGDAICSLETRRLLVEHNHNVVLWGMHHSNNPKLPFDDYFVKYIDFDNIKGIKNRMKAVVSILYSFEAKAKITYVLKSFKPDIVHLNNFAHQISPSILHAIKNERIPMVMTMHDYKLVCPAYSMFSNSGCCEECRGRRYYRCIINRCAKNSYSKSTINCLEMYLHHDIMGIYNLIDIFIAPSFFLKNEVEEMGFNLPVTYLPNFIDSKNYQPQYEFTKGIFCYFGRLSPEKGIFTMLKAFAAKSAKLRIIGDGPLGEEINSMIKKEGLNNVEMLGYKSGDELQKSIKESMAVIIPSECYENNPRSALEAFALGKPVIGARIGGIPELVIDGETGLTFKSGDEQDLSKKINCLMSNSDMVMKMGKIARKTVEQKYNSENHYRNLLAIYNNAINNSEINIE
ncbi:MAG: hypothetical protein A2Y62_08370 [Candidatus Fischerbacteria bacterium RBG_13_37_8]|uniref:Group 1 glycosyl transferase n=1 Tax=Candidatus Fischerbacteria bacterium RBG_13_37_8 TaxID=1817863 RepID=A0A1F5VXG2_9BACT|nr:MAG: hypothetical protein A2Y62_08370 [Candidatus Fischerbacteria bacterium RBG_13_37_8]